MKHSIVVARWSRVHWREIYSVLYISKGEGVKETEKPRCSLQQVNKEAHVGRDGKHLKKSADDISERVVQENFYSNLDLYKNSLILSLFNTFYFTSNQSFGDVSESHGM